MHILLWIKQNLTMCVYLAFFNKTMLVTFHHCDKIFKKNNLKKKRLGLMFSGHAQLTPLFFMSVTRQRCHRREVRNYSESRKGL